MCTSQYKHDELLYKKLLPKKHEKGTQRHRNHGTERNDSIYSKYSILNCINTDGDTGSCSWTGPLDRLCAVEIFKAFKFYYLTITLDFSLVNCAITLSKKSALDLVTEILGFCLDVTRYLWFTNRKSPCNYTHTWCKS